MSVLQAILGMVDDERKLFQAAADLKTTGNVLSGFEKFFAGEQARKAYGFQADQLRQNAGQAQAAAQRDAISADRQDELIASRALAVAAASGGGASDPTVINLIAKNAAEGAYRKQMALYAGDDKARSMMIAADAADYSGRSARVSGLMGAAGSFINAGASNTGTGMFAKYGGYGPKRDY